MLLHVAQLDITRVLINFESVTKMVLEANPILSCISLIYLFDRGRSGLLDCALLQFLESVIPWGNYDCLASGAIGLRVVSLELVEHAVREAVRVIVEREPSQVSLLPPLDVEELLREQFVTFQFAELLILSMLSHAAILSNVQLFRLSRLLGSSHIYGGLRCLIYENLSLEDVSRPATAPD